MSASTAMEQDEESHEEQWHREQARKKLRTNDWYHTLLTDDHIEIIKKLQLYYDQLFPFEDMCTWLSYGNIGSLRRREFSYVMLPKRFRRYQSFDSFKDMKHHMRSFCPAKIDIGAIYNGRPKKDKDNKLRFYPVERELIFDIDLSDYNAVRSCCTGNKICQKCWKFAAVAVKILHTSFVADFAWKHILWVFSGRRGIHCWICDPDVRRFDGNQRKHILNYYSLPKPGLVYDDDDDDDGKRSKRRPLDLFSHNLMRRSFILAEEYFVNVCLNEQDVLRTPENVNQFLKLLPSVPCREKVTELFAECSTSFEKWTKFEEFWKNEEQSQTSLWALRPHLPKHIVLYYLYPRVDVSVSVTMNHLLKAPFSLHPDSLLVCTPFDPLKVDEFNVSEVSSLDQLLNAAKSKGASSEISATEKTAILRYQESRLVFGNFVKKMSTI